MESNVRIHSEEELNSDMKYQTSSSNNMPNTIQNKNYNTMSLKKNNKVPKINIRKISHPIKHKNIQNQTFFNENLKISKDMHNTSPYTFKYFCNIANKKKSLYNSSLGINSIKEKNDMESNFISLSKNANIYTSNAEYIQNKKMLLFKIKQILIPINISRIG